MKRIYLTALAVILALSSVLAIAPPLLSADSGQIMGQHIVVEGETLYCIGRGYRVLPSAIAQASGLSANAKLSIGQVLNIPAVQWVNIPPGPVCKPQFQSPFTPTATPTSGTTTPASTTPAPQPTTPTSTTMPPGEVCTYTIQRGDTLYRIARKFNTTVAAIKATNNLPTDTIYAGHALAIPNVTNALTDPACNIAAVIRIIDGDTIDVDWAGTIYRVRYIGINTPESNQSCYAEATAANTALVSGQVVRLAKDVSETDRYGRLLRYVYVGDVFVNATLVARGYAEAVAYPPDISQAAYLEGLEAQARAANVACYTTGIFGSTPLPTSTQPGNCDSAYPSVCIPPPPPDLDCKDIPYTNFIVLPPDPHRFDGDNDSIGCER